MMTKRLEGQVGFITGSDSGMGQATAIAFAREGADVVVTYHRDKAGAEKTREAAEQYGARVLVAQLDVSQPEQVAALFAQAKEELGTVTILVNNAGKGGGDKVRDMKIEDWKMVIDTDLSGPFYCAQQFIRGIEGTDRRGVIINITSVHEDLPQVGGAAYCASKGGLRNLTRCLALELADMNINVVNIAPGMIHTPMTQSAFDDPETLKQKLERIPKKRAGEPEDIAELAVFLASNDATYIHGTTVFCDGGLMQSIGR